MCQISKFPDTLWFVIISWMFWRNFTTIRQIYIPYKFAQRGCIRPKIKCEILACKGRPRNIRQRRQRQRQNPRQKGWSLAKICWEYETVTLCQETLVCACSENWTLPKVAILGADQKKSGLWGREWSYRSSAGRVNCASADWVTYIPIIAAYTSGSLKCSRRMLRMLETQLCVPFGKWCFFTPFQRFNLSQNQTFQKWNKTYA